MINVIFVSIRFIINGQPIAIPVIFQDGTMDMEWHDYICGRALCSHEIRVRETRAAVKLFAMSESTDEQLDVAVDCERDWTSRVCRMKSLWPASPEVEAALASSRRFVRCLNSSRRKAAFGKRRGDGRRKPHPDTAAMVHRLRRHFVVRDAEMRAYRKEEPK